MTATERIRAMLDERGVEYRTHGMTDRTWFDVDGISWFVIERENGGIAVEAVFLTPEQAIEATLGRGTCNNTAPSYLDFLCSECGFVHYHSDANDSGDGNEWRYCPNCGRRIEVEA